ncbi:hypothetical protein [Streptomyces sp. NPDC060031]|uniref:hypothetical protein n=1 Tax=Streptomyces sp. NPDC060031 TaxID=3347043 RepID=UPI0036A2B852
MLSDPGDVQVRPGMEAGLEAISDACGQDVRETAVTFDTVAVTPEQHRSWLRSRPEDGPHRPLVACGTRITRPAEVVTRPRH